MASSLLLNPISCINQVSHVGDMFPRRHSFGQVCLPMKKQRSSSLLTQTLAYTSFISPSHSTDKVTLNKQNLSLSLSHLWRRLHGSNNWEGLVEPLHPFLREEIIRYGELLAACYKAFDIDPNSKRYLNCKYGKNNILKEVGLEDSGYEVTKYIYATPDINLNLPIQNDATCGRWIGYVAVSKDDDVIKRLGRRDIIITFRGTITNSEWIANLMSFLTPARLDPNNPREEVMVEQGFLSLYTSDESDEKFGLGSCREQLLSEVSRLLKKYKGEEISISLAGHSMGSSLAVLLAYDICELGLNKVSTGGWDVPVTVFSFGGPRVGNLRFKERCDELGVKVLRIVNVNDPITKLPGVFLNESVGDLGGKYEFLWNWNFSCYAHVGVELVLDFFNVQNPCCVHDLEAYISLLKFPKAVEKFPNVGQEGFLNRAKEVLPNTTANLLDVFPLRNVASNIVNLVQSQRAEYLLSIYILGWMDFLAFYMFLYG